MQAKWHLDQPDIALPKFRTAAAIFPLHSQFREAPAVYAIFAQRHGLISSSVALTEVRNAMDFNKNSNYLAAHLARLRGIAP